MTAETREIAADVDASTLTDLDHMRSSRRTSFVGRFGVATTAEEGTVAEIAVGPASLRFFDPSSGTRITT